MEEETKKVTKKEYYGMLRSIVEESDASNKEELVSFIDKQIELLDRKTEKAKEAAAKKKAEGDELRTTIEAILTEDYQTIAEIMEQLNEDEEISRAKVTARLTQLINEGIAEKADGKAEDGKKVKVYKRA